MSIDSALTTTVQPGPMWGEGRSAEEWRDHIRELQSYFGLTRNHIASMAGCSPQAITNFLKGRQGLSVDRQNNLRRSYMMLEGVLTKFRGEFSSKDSLFFIILYIIAGEGENSINSEAVISRISLRPDADSVFDSASTYFNPTSSTSAQKRTQFILLYANKFVEATLDKGFGQLLVEIAGPDSDSIEVYFKQLCDSVDLSFLTNPDLVNRLASSFLLDNVGLDKKALWDNFLLLMQEQFRTGDAPNSPNPTP